MKILFLRRRINRILYLNLKIAFLTILTRFFLLPSSAFAEKEKKEDGRLPGWSYPIINRLPFVKNPTAQRAISLSIGQLIFTPLSFSKIAGSYIF